MPVIDKAPLSGPVRLACVISRYHQDITDKMLAGVQSQCEALGISENQLTVVWVPGAVEIPVVAKQCALTQTYDAVMCLGLVIKGETAHFDYVASQCSQGCRQVSLETGVPVIFGVLTTLNHEQALARVGGDRGHVGIEVVETAVHMVSVMQQLKKNSS